MQDWNQGRSLERATWTLRSAAEYVLDIFAVQMRYCLWVSLWTNKNSTADTAYQPCLTEKNSVSFTEVNIRLRWWSVALAFRLQR